tara:strand:+ start:15893 stop:16069 length:177 start_codon:yes stop_codon:yes gene_type:complete
MWQGGVVENKWHGVIRKGFRERRREIGEMGNGEKRTEKWGEKRAGKALVLRARKKNVK